MRTTILKLVALVGWSVGTAFVASAAALQSLLWGLPPTDAAHGAPLWLMGLDPFVLTVALTVAVPGGVLGAITAVLLLWNTDLARSVPIVSAVTVAAAFVFAPMHVFAALPTLVIGLLAMAYCRSQFPAVPA